MRPNEQASPPRPAEASCPHEADLAAAREKIVHLERALITSRRIGTAVGILMATYKVTDRAAFDMLVMASQNRSCKLHEIAEQVNDTGVLIMGRRRN